MIKWGKITCLEWGSMRYKVETWFGRFRELTNWLYNDRKILFPIKSYRFQETDFQIKKLKIGTMIQSVLNITIKTETFCCYGSFDFNVWWHVSMKIFFRTAKWKNLNHGLKPRYSEKEQSITFLFKRKLYAINKEVNSFQS